jgi:hypothetical protein
MTALDLDAIHWQETAEGHYMPRTAPADINYPSEDDVENGVMYGYEDQYEGTLPATGESPDAPSLDALVVGDGQLTVTVSLNDAGEPAYVLYRTATAGWTLPDEDLKLLADGEVVINGLHNGTLYYVCAVSKVGLTYSLPSVVMAARPEPAGATRARYRVVGIEHMPGAATQTLVLERIERPTHP